MTPGLQSNQVWKMMKNHIKFGKSTHVFNLVELLPCRVTKVTRCELGFSRLKIGCCRHPAGWVGDLGFQIDNIDSSIRSLRGRTGSHQYF